MKMPRYSYAEPETNVHAQVFLSCWVELCGTHGGNAPVGDARGNLCFYPQEALQRAFCILRNETKLVSLQK